YELANLLLQERPTIPDAVGFFRAALALRPQNVVIHSNLGSAFLAQGMPAEAEAAFRKAIELNADLAGAWGTFVSLGFALREQGKLPEATDAFRTAMELKPDNTWAYYRLGETLREMGKQADADDTFRKILLLKPDLA